MSQIKTYPEMNETIKDLLRRSEEPMQLYILARIEELEKQVSDLTPPPNDPLTLEELREMDGEPVYIGFGDCGEWAIIRLEGDKIFLLHKNGIYGPVKIAFECSLNIYRRKPEEGTT